MVKAIRSPCGNVLHSGGVATQSNPVTEYYMQLKLIFIVAEKVKMHNVRNRGMYLPGLIATGVLWMTLIRLQSYRRSLDIERVNSPWHFSGLDDLV